MFAKGRDRCIGRPKLIPDGMDQEVRDYLVQPATKPKRAHKTPPQSLVREWLIYSCAEGIFRWRKSPTNSMLAGQQAGYINNGGRILIHVRGFGQILAHRLAWIYVNGPIPMGYEIDHIDGDPTNNKLSNLRLATRRQQGANRRCAKHSQTGLKGVVRHRAGRKKFQAYITLARKRFSLGYFLSAEEAHAAYANAAARYFGAFACPDGTRGAGP